MTIGELYDVLCMDKTHEMYAQIDDEYIPVSASYEVYDNVVYFYRAVESSIHKINWRAKSNDIMDAILLEAKDSCWSGNEFRTENTFQYCEVMFCNEDDDEGCEKCYNITNVKEFDDCWILECE